MVAVQLLSRVWLFVTPWTAAHQASLSFTITQSLLKLMSIESVTLSNHLVLCCPLLLLPLIFSSISIFSNELSLCRGIGASASVLPKIIRGWFPLGLTSLTSSKSKGLSRILSSTTVEKHQFFSAPPSLWSNSHILTWLLEKLQLWWDGPLLVSNVSAF